MAVCSRCWRTRTDNQIGDAGARALADALVKAANSSLKTLHLGCTCLAVAGLCEQWQVRFAFCGFGSLRRMLELRDAVLRLEGFWLLRAVLDAFCSLRAVLCAREAVLLGVSS